MARASESPASPGAVCPQRNRHAPRRASVVRVDLQRHAPRSASRDKARPEGDGSVRAASGRHPEAAGDERDGALRVIAEGPVRQAGVVVPALRKMHGHRVPGPHEQRKLLSSELLDHAGRCWPGAADQDERANDQVAWIGESPGEVRLGSRGAVRQSASRDALSGRGRPRACWSPRRFFASWRAVGLATGHKQDGNSGGCGRACDRRTSPDPHAPNVRPHCPCGSLPERVCATASRGSRSTAWHGE